jgi:very-short-patch-repair endonuclease
MAGASLLSDVNGAGSSTYTGIAPPSRTRWQDPEYRIYLEKCESPAEEAFLKEMLATWYLEPAGNALRALDILLEMQVPLQKYRFDFLIDKWLVVEIDGATYHSAAEAVKRDLLRDDIIRAEGLDVLRIPAKFVFENPEGAVRRVLVKLAEGHFEGRRNVAEKVALVEPKPRKRFSVLGALKFLGTVVGDIEKAAHHLNDFRDLQVAIKGGSLEGPQETFRLERGVIDLSIKVSQSQISAGSYRNQSADHARWYDDAHRVPEPVLNNNRVELCTSVPTFSPPATSSNEVSNSEILRGFQVLSKTRSAYFGETREKLQKNAKLAKFVRSNLEKHGHLALWQAIAP